MPVKCLFSRERAKLHLWSWSLIDKASAYFEDIGMWPTNNLEASHSCYASGKCSSI